MFTIIWDFLRETKEWQGLGFNQLTLVAGFILFVEAPWLLWGRWRQIQTLWEPERTTPADVAGMSMTKEFAVFSYYFISFNYGVMLRSVALMTALSIGILDALIVFRLLRLKRLAWWEWGVGLVGLSLIVAAFSTPWRYELFLLMSTVLVFPLVAQPLEMLQRQSAAGLNPRVPLTGVFSTSVWTIYGVMIGNLMIAGFSILYLIIYTTILLLWREFRTK